jgi:YaiO family outer membrane protein
VVRDVVRRTLWAVLFAACLPSALLAQACDWTGRASYTREWFRGSDASRTDWQNVHGQLDCRHRTGAVLAELLAVQRFSEWDPAGALGVYQETWDRAYVFARLQLAPAAVVIPVTDVTVEAFQGLAYPLETSLGYRRMQYRDEGFNIWTASVARLTERAQVRLRGTLVPHRSHTAGSVSVIGKRFFRSVEEFVEGSVALGSEAVTTGLVAGVPRVELWRTSAFSVRASRHVGPRWCWG